MTLQLYIGVVLALVGIADVAVAQDNTCANAAPDISGLYTSGLFINDEQSPSKSNQVFDFDMKHTGNFSMSWWMVINSPPEETWENVFHKGATKGERGPGLWLHPDVHDNNWMTYGVHISTSTTGNTNPSTDLGFVNGLTIAQSTWYHYTITYGNNGNGNSMEKVYFNGQLEISRERSSETNHDLSSMDTPFYFSDPWYDAADVTLKNLVFSPTVWTDSEVNDVRCGTQGNIRGAPGALGDPHFKTWTGERFDFHGACDLVLLQNHVFDNNKGMDIHIRTKFTKQWSYIESAVLRIGKETLEVTGGTDLEEYYWINKVANGNLDHGIAGFKTEYKKVNSKQRQFIVYLGLDKGKIILQTFKDFVRVDVEDGSRAVFRGSVGLMGVYGTGEKVGRDKTTVIPDTNAFGLEWQVQGSETMLFHNVDGVQAPERCAMPRRTIAHRRLGEVNMSMADAEFACSRVNASDRDACIFDVLATND